MPRTNRTRESLMRIWSPTDFWFRGHARADWPLTPSIYRPTRAGTDEVEMHAEFERRGRQLFSEAHLPRDHKEWYFLMQHYRTPTRLLDWTDGALLALYFALSEHVREQERQRPLDAAVWMLDPEWLNRRTWKRLDPEHSYTEGVMLTEWAESDPWFPVPFGEKPLLVPEPIAIDPPHVARRVAVQHSHFTVHGTRQDGLERLANERDSRLVKITIQQGKAKSILRDLATSGITETTVFPDLEGLSRELHLKLLYRPRARLSTPAARLTLRRRKRPTS